MIWVIGGTRFERAFKDFYSRLINDATTDFNKTVGAIHTLKELQSKVAELEVTKSQIEEKYNKREREIEHKLGLERQRQEQELKLKEREVTVKVREENLVADRKRFEGQMEFHEKRFTEEVTYLKDMIKPLLEALPKMTIKETTRKR